MNNMNNLNNSKEIILNKSDSSLLQMLNES